MRGAVALGTVLAGIIVLALARADTVRDAAPAGGDGSEEFWVEQATAAHFAAANRDVFERLVGGRRSLAGAVDELERINAGRDGWPANILNGEPTTTPDRDVYARWVLRRVDATFERDASRLVEVRARLEREYLALTGRRPEDLHNPLGSSE